MKALGFTLLSFQEREDYWQKKLDLSSNLSPIAIKTIHAIQLLNTTLHSVFGKGNLQKWRFCSDMIHDPENAIQSQDVLKISPIAHAILQGCNEQEVISLLKHGEDVNRAEQGNTPITLAILRMSSPISQEDPAREGLLTEIEHIIPVLLKAGALVDDETIELAKKQNIPLNILDLLESNKIGKTTRSVIKRETLLMEEAIAGDIVKMKALLENGAEVNTQSLSGNTALFLACEHGQLDSVNLLLKRPDIDVNKLNKEGFSPIMAAVKRQDIEIIEVLLKAKANPSLKNAEGKTAYDLAYTKWGREKAGQKIQDPINKLKSLKIIEMLTRIDRK